jgi:hypothetical protein
MQGHRAGSAGPAPPPTPPSRPLVAAERSAASEAALARWHYFSRRIKVIASVQRLASWSRTDSSDTSSLFESAIDWEDVRLIVDVRW